MEAFVYCWTDKKTNMLYVGSHKGSTNDGYVCSSKYMLEEYNKRPEDFSRQIIAEGKFEDIRALEAAILKSVNAKINEQFYNMHENDGNFYLKFHTEETKNKISKANTGNNRPDLSERNKKGPSKTQIEKQVATKRKLGYYLSENNPMYGKKHTEFVKKAHSKRMSGENNPNFGKTISEETKRKMSESRKKYWELKRAH